MAKVVWLKRAADQLDQIAAYIELFDVEAASRMAAKLIALSESLADFPARGRPVGDGRREMTTVRPYVMRYRVIADTVFIISVRHARRQTIR